MKKIIKYILSLVLIIGVFLGGYIYSAMEHVPPHFHANFAVYVDGERVDFSGDQYMEDVAGCSITGEIMPKDRAHLHENNADTIHIHAAGVSWGHFFANNDITFGDNYLALDTGELYTNTEGKTMSYVLNGKVRSSTYNKLINSEDRLLVAYGDESEQELLELYNTVSDNAGEFNHKYDPGSCGGTNENGLLVILREFVHSFHDMEH